jgi:hypothetical protein
MKKTKTIVLATSLMMLLTGSAIAANPTPFVKHSTPPSNNPLTVDFLGEDANYLIFRITVNTASNQSVSIAVNDKVEGELYSAEINSNKVQTYKIEKRAYQELDFQLQIGGKIYSTSYSNLMTSKRNK